MHSYNQKDSFALSAREAVSNITNHGRRYAVPCICWLASHSYGTHSGHSGSQSSVRASFTRSHKGKYAFKSMTGVPSRASSPASCSSPLSWSMARIRHVVMATGLGLYSARVAKMPIRIALALEQLGLQDATMLVIIPLVCLPQHDDVAELIKVLK